MQGSNAKLRIGDPRGLLGVGEGAFVREIGARSSINRRPCKGLKEVAQSSKFRNNFCG
jgi:hypothetical protein